jgi:hypothetical protein
MGRYLYSQLLYGVHLGPFSEYILGLARNEQNKQKRQLHLHIVQHWKPFGFFHLLNGRHTNAGRRIAGAERVQRIARPYSMGLNCNKNDYWTLIDKWQQ